MDSLGLLRLSPEGKAPGGLEFQVTVGTFVFSCIVPFAYLGKHRNEPVELFCFSFLTTFIPKPTCTDNVTSKTRLERMGQACWLYGEIHHVGRTATNC